MSKLATLIELCNLTKAPVTCHFCLIILAQIYSIIPPKLLVTSAFAVRPNTDTAIWLFSQLLQLSISP